MHRESTLIAGYHSGLWEFLWIDDLDLGNGLFEVRCVVRDEPVRACCNRRRKMHSVSGAKIVTRPKCSGEFGRCLILRSDVESSQQFCQSFDLGLSAIT